MKKMTITAALILALVAAAAWSQKTVEELDGFYWVKLDHADKLMIVEGYWLAEIAMMKEQEFRMIDREDLTDEKKEAVLIEIKKTFLTPGTLGDMIAEIDRSYADYGSREIPLWFVLGLVHHPDWYALKK